MCTNQSERQFLVCDVAIGRVRGKITAAFGAKVRYTPVEGQGTLVEAAPEVDAERFLALTRAAIADAPDTDQHRASHGHQGINHSPTT